MGPAPPGRANGMSQASRSFLDLLWIFGRILTSRGFRPYLDMYKDTLAIYRLAWTSPPFVDIF
ncbi:hypothetical protein Taro_035511 [Colocasia esculenta]|uniref:Uncharacterized protein n=1 Tax=Colocasia esculenta TaxID=4460 RepID=A0A843VUM8_COLES|nr:hypothetical protein [Colocasia esculenta]